MAAGSKQSSATAGLLLVTASEACSRQPVFRRHEGFIFKRGEVGRNGRGGLLEIYDFVREYNMVYV